MNTFNLYLSLGFDHIIDFNGYDHILFVATLCGVYLLKQWKQILVLVTAFTIGHSVTLALATLNILNISSELVEFLIPLTIAITCITNITFRKQDVSLRLHLIKYITAMFFGLIHGLGFSNYLRSLLGNEQSIVKPLLAFNVGLEIGQIAIVAVILGMSFVLVSLLKINKFYWNFALSSVGFIIAFILMYERFTF